MAGGGGAIAPATIGGHSDHASDAGIGVSVGWSALRKSCADDESGGADAAGRSMSLGRPLDDPPRRGMAQGHRGAYPRGRSGATGPGRPRQPRTDAESVFRCQLGAGQFLGGIMKGKKLVEFQAWMVQEAM